MTQVLEQRFEVAVEPNVWAPMRDGVRLRATIWRPRSDGRFPVIVQRVGYDTALFAEYGQLFAGHGYVFVCQNVRGIHGSEGEYEPWQNDGWGELQDGYDTVERAAA